MEKLTEKGSSAVVSRPHDHQDMGVEGLRGNSSVRTTETLVRIVPMGFCVTAMVMMLKNSQTNDFGSVSYSDLGGFKYLVYANGICAGYSFLSAFFTAVNRPSTIFQTWTFFFFDQARCGFCAKHCDPSISDHLICDGFGRLQAMTYMILAAGALSAEVLYLAENGDAAITWSEACSVFDLFCRKAKMSTVITFATMVCYAVLSLLSSYRLFSNYDAPISFPCNNRGTEMPVFAA
ncbi:hypothetical protein Syun_012201 [Stephania yunnanensis]|uniref:CASP-like protein n=1 Tax=Stephania yunnanensis TaxID=152371 RepID=A0AAP0JZ77_9MAGN